MSEKTDDWKPDWHALNAIWKRIDPYASKDMDITVSSDQIREMVFKLADQRDQLRDAAKLALEEMCHTVAPRNSFTDAVDALDAALHPKPTAPTRS